MFNQNFLLLKCWSKKRKKKSARNEIGAQQALGFQVTVHVKYLSVTPCINLWQAATRSWKTLEAQEAGRSPAVCRSPCSALHRSSTVQKGSAPSKLPLLWHLHSYSPEINQWNREVMLNLRFYRYSSSEILSCHKNFRVRWQFRCCGFWFFQCLLLFCCVVFVLLKQDLLLISSWLSLTRKSSLYPVMHLDHFLKYSQRQDMQTEEITFLRFNVNPSEFT